MMYTAFLLALLVGYVSAGAVCKGWPRQLNGKKCASTTHYHDSHKGACGCGNPNNDNPFGWNQDHFVAAANQLYFDRNRKGWCGEKCGQCVKLTPTGGYVDGRGGPTTNTRSHVFMVTNLCPAVDPNLDWCAQPTPPDGGGTNKFGYAYHFDLEDGAHEVTNLGWNNPEVIVEEVSCYGDSLTPNDGMFRTCQCGH